MQQTSLIWPLFGYRGRISRSQFWMAAAIYGSSLGSQLGETADTVFQLAASAISIWAFIELGCLRGTSGTNAYGPDPIDVRPQRP